MKTSIRRSSYRPTRNKLGQVKMSYVKPHLVTTTRPKVFRPAKPIKTFRKIRPFR